VHIVHGKQMSTSSLFRRDMVDVRSSDAEATFGGRPAAGALTPLFNGSKVFGIYGIANVEDAR